MRSVLFVCTANICRSPMAMALWKDLVSRKDPRTFLEGWRIESAGTWTINGEPAAFRLKAVLSEKGLNLNEHRSRVVTRALVSSFNLILTMERGHKEALRAEFPELADRIFLLSEMAGKIRDIQDPMGGSLLDFQDTAREISDYLERGYDEIFLRAGATVDKTPAT